MADDPLAALGITVQRLQDAIKAQAADIAQLQAQVNSAPAATTQVQAPWWLDLSDADRAARLDSLKTWVAEVLVIEYAGYFAPWLPGCWPAHREAVWELSVLWANWQTWEPPSLSLAAATQWHDRYLPGVVRRLRTSLESCKQATRGCRLTQ